MHESPVKVRRGCAPIALLGCGCGLLSGIGIILVFFLMSVQLVHELREPGWSRDDFAQCQQNLEYLRQALDNYRTDYHRYPARLEELSPHYLDVTTRMRCPLEIKGRGVRYVYQPDAARPTDPLVTCVNHGQGPIVLQVNGRLRLPTALRRK